MAQTLEQTREYRKKTPRFSLYSTLRLAKKRAEVTIDVDYLLDLFEKQKGLCSLSGIEMTWATGKTEPTSISIDRIDNSKGYIEGNVRLVCTCINAFKTTMTDDELFIFAKQLTHKMSQSRLN